MFSNGADMRMTHLHKPRGREASKDEDRGQRVSPPVVKTVVKTVVRDTAKMKTVAKESPHLRVLG